jgi:hypothetical protein
MVGNDKAGTSGSCEGLAPGRDQDAAPPVRLAANVSSDPLSDLIRQPIDVGQVPGVVCLHDARRRGIDAVHDRRHRDGSLLNDGPAEWAFAVYSEGNVVASGRQKLEGGTGPWLAALSAKLLPGQYQLRAAVRDHAGRAGVVERAINVGLRGDAKVQFSDLLLGVADANGRLQPASQIPQGATMSALFEVITGDEATLETAKTMIEIVPGGTATPVKRFMMAARSGTLAAIVNNQAEIAGLKPGRYTAIATPMIGEQPLGKVSRIFEIVGK